MDGIRVMVIQLGSGELPCGTQNTCFATFLLFAFPAYVSFAVSSERTPDDDAADNVLSSFFRPKWTYAIWFVKLIWRVLWASQGFKKGQ